MRRKYGAKEQVRDTRYHLIAIPFLLTIVGCYFIMEASAIEATDTYKDSLYFLKQQAVAFGVSIGAFLVFGNLSLEFIKRNAYYLMLLTIVLLLLVLIPGIGVTVNGARRWIHLPFLGSLQPSEFAKFSAILYCSAWFMKKEAKRFASFIVLTGLIFGLVMLQPDMGSAGIIAFIMMGLYVTSDNDIRALLLWAVPILALGAALILHSPYRMERVKALFDPSQDALGVSYHINQVFIALQSGGLWGQGIGLSRQRYAYLPESHTDSIFAIIAEDVGFFGSILLIGAYVLFLYSIYLLILRTTNPYAKLLATGILIYFSSQIIVNLGSMVGILPLTGVPLPFVSYGGTSLLLSFICVGILFNIAKHYAK